MEQPRHFLMENASVFDTARNRKVSTYNKTTVSLASLQQPYPAERQTVYCPDKQLYPYGKRLVPVDGPLKGQIVRVMCVRAQVEDCDDYLSYGVGFGNTILFREWIPEHHLGPL